MTPARPSAISASDALASLFSAAGSSFFGGGYAVRAMVADVHPIHQPAQLSLSLSRASGSSRHSPAARINAQTQAEPTLYAL